jgi:hypothetical protein
MTQHNPFAGETPFPAAGEGVILKFTNSDILRLHSVYGPDVRHSPDTDPVSGRVRNAFWTNMIGWISLHDPVVIDALLRAGLKEPGPDGKLQPIKRPESWWEDPGFSYSDVAELIEHGLMWSRWGMTPDQLAARMRAEMEQAAAEGGQSEDPQTGATTTPQTSSV